jgi:putative transposase
MSEKYKVRDQDRPYFITFAVTEWVDVFTRQQYKDIVLDSIRYCQREKDLMVYAWCLMTNPNLARMFYWSRAKVTFVRL